AARAAGSVCFFLAMWGAAANLVPAMVTGLRRGQSTLHRYRPGWRNPPWQVAVKYGAGPRSNPGFAQLKPYPYRDTMDAHFKFWPKGLPHDLNWPQTTLCHNLEVSAARFPGKTAIVYEGTEISYARLLQEVNALAGYLQQRCGVARGDRVAIFSQNCSQFVIAYYAILRAGGVVVPVNVMSTSPELRYIAEHSDARLVLA